MNSNKNTTAAEAATEKTHKNNNNSYKYDYHAKLWSNGMMLPDPIPSSPNSIMTAKMKTMSFCCLLGDYISSTYDNRYKKLEYIIYQ